MAKYSSAWATDGSPGQGRNVAGVVDGEDAPVRGVNGNIGRVRLNRDKSEGALADGIPLEIVFPVSRPVSEELCWAWSRATTWSSLLSRDATLEPSLSVVSG